jgi:DNA replication and repair protein RecF
VKNRNLLLKEPVLNERLLDVYDGYLAETGARIMAERAGFVARLAKISAGIQDSITAGSANKPEEEPMNESAGAKEARLNEIKNQSTANTGRLEVSYEPSIEPPRTEAAAPLDGDRTRQWREAIADELRVRRAKDRDAGATTKGPHKDDLKLASGGVDLRKYGSQGQQRTAALALKLAEVDIIKEETGEMPILLLDDVLSELDEDRQRYLLGSFEDCQIIITTAEFSDDLTKAFPAARRIEIKRQ